MPHSRFGRDKRVQLRAEEVNPEIPVRWDPQESLADTDEGGRLRDRIRREVVQLHPIVVTQSAHEAARRRREAVLVVADEADDVAVRWVGLPIHHQWDYPRRGLPVHIRCKLVVVHKLVQGKPHHCRVVPW
jgi:hypothetical protein